MSTTDKVLFVQVVREDNTLPVALREHADEVKALEKRQLDTSYLKFLDEQIRLSPRGKEWSDILKRRRDALAAYNGITLLDGVVRTENLFFSVKIHPQLKKIVHWEQYEMTEEG